MKMNKNEHIKKMTCILSLNIQEHYIVLYLEFLTALIVSLFIAFFPNTIFLSSGFKLGSTLTIYIL